MSARRLAFFLLAGLGLAGCLLVGFVAVRLVLFVHAVAPRASLADVMRMIHNDPDAVAAEENQLGRVNFLLLGYGGPGHDGPYLTDSIMVVSEQTDTHQLAMISIPRDLWIAIPTNRFGLNWTTKINGAYTIGIEDSVFPSKAPQYRGPLGGGNLSAEMIHRVTGQPIQYWVAIGFEGFRRVVDAVDGVDIVVPRALDDREYPAGETTGFMHVHFDAGPQHMDGARALEFARLRHTDGGDFDRSRRQQLILLAVRQKVLSVGGIPKLLGLMNALQGHFQTNMNLQQIRLFADVMSRLEVGNPARISVDNTNFLYTSHSSDGQYILLPYDPSYSNLHHYLDQAILDPAMIGEAAPVRFLRGTTAYGGRQNIADLTAQLLSWLGVTSAGSGEAPAHTYRQSEVHDYTGGKAPATVSYLAAFFNARVVVEPGPPPPGATVVVMIGRDFAQTFMP